MFAALSNLSIGWVGRDCIYPFFVNIGFISLAATILDHGHITIQLSGEFCNLHSVATFGRIQLYKQVSKEFAILILNNIPAGCKDLASKNKQRKKCPFILYKISWYTNSTKSCLYQIIMTSNQHPGCSNQYKLKKKYYNGRIARRSCYRVYFQSNRIPHHCIVCKKEHWF